MLSEPGHVGMLLIAGYRSLMVLVRAIEAQDYASGFPREC